MGRGSIERANRAYKSSRVFLRTLIAPLFTFFLTKSYELNKLKPCLSFFKNSTPATVSLPLVNNKKSPLAIPFCFILLLLFNFYPSSFVEGMEIELSETKRIMGTMVEVTVLAKNIDLATKAIELAFLQVIQVDKLMSSYKKTSDVNRLSKHSGKKPTLVHPLTMNVIERSIYYGNLSSGAFDITTGKIKRLYKLKSGGEIPTADTIKSIQKMTGYKKIKILGKNKVFLPVQGMEIDLGGIAKGYAIDMAIQALKDVKIERGMVNAGGDLRVIGKKRAGLWRVGIMDPRKTETLLGVVQLSDMSIATSGDYMQFFEKKGIRYSHIIDPITGAATPKSRSVTVIAPLAIDSDALSTTVSVLGPEKGMKLIESIKNTEVMIATERGNLLFSNGFRKFFKSQ